MKTNLLAAFCTCCAISVAATAWADTEKGGKIDGKKEFEKHCAVCHPQGGNTMKPEKTLKKKDLQANGIKNAAGIVKTMRNPGPGMTPFDKQTIDDREAKAIAQYVLKAFK